MKSTQLLMAGALALAFVAPGCSREQTTQEAREASQHAREAAADVRTAAARAGETLADGWLSTKIQSQYFVDDDIKARYIDVTSRDGVVTLKGFVESTAVRDEALQIARNTDGVRQVQDQLLIGRPANEAFGQPSQPSAVATSGNAAVPPGAMPADDTAITTAVQARYFMDAGIKARDISVTARGGVVTLRGTVASDQERAQALQLARGTHGVTRVEDALTVDASIVPPIPSAQATPNTSTPAAVGTSGIVPNSGTGTTDTTEATGATTATGARPEDQTLEQRIRTALSGNRQLRGASGIDVSARDGVVLLRGTVPNQASKQQAISAARQAEGVVQVVDRLTVAGSR